MKSSGVNLIVILLLCCAGVASSLPAQDAQRQVPDKLIELFFKDLCTGALKCSDDELALWRSRLTYRKHDLNGDKIPEYFLSIDHHTWCGAGSNCDDTVYMKSGRGYKVIASDKVLTVIKTRTNGYLDMESHVKMSACTLPDGANGWGFAVTSYKFNGEKYEASTETERRCLRR